jgi:UDP-N-acetylglucosamine diphosphorylase/glucosamine-1-phosphate N-acetyltransferase
MPVFTESHCREDLFPITLTRHTADIRVGILTIREKWMIAAPDESKLNVPIPANLVPGTEFFAMVDSLGLQHALEHTDLYRQFQYAWELNAINQWAIEQDFQLLTQAKVSAPLPTGIQLTGNASQVFLEEGVHIEHCYLNTVHGPIYISAGAQVMEGAMLRGPLSIGKDAVVKMGAAIYGATTIGPACVVGGEIRNSIITGYSNKAHDGYLGDAWIGEWCNLGAGTSCSNLRNTATPVNVWHMHSKQFVKGGLKCGLVMGDHSKCSINTSFNTATVVGVCANIFQPGALLPKFIPSFSWGVATGLTYELQKAIQDINNWMAFKGMQLSDVQIRSLTEIFNNTDPL